jgi:hypothetical protein
MDSATVRARYRERPDYRVDVLARTNVMTAWLGEIWDGKGTFTGVRP